MSKLRWTAAAAALLLALTACGDSADTLSLEAPAQESGEGAPAAEAPEETAPADAARDALGTGGTAAPAALQTTTDIGRDIIFTAQLTVAVNDVAAAGAEATQVVESFGGILFGQETSAFPEPRSVLVFKVRPEDFQAVLAELGAIGELRTQNVSAEDVTERVVDLESRIETAAASVERLKQFLGEANDIVTISELEAQLLDRETQLETLRGQLRTIRDRVDLATITLTLTEALANPQVDLAVSAYRGHEDAGLSCPGEGGITVDRDDDVTVCFQIANAGDTPLTGFTLTDPVLELDIDDLLVVSGDPSATIQPGQVIELAAEIRVSRTVRTQTRLSAIPVDPDGRPLDARSVASTDTVAIGAVDPGGLPGFQDGLSAAWEVLRWLGGLAVLLAGAAVPFLWLPVLIWLAARWLRGRRRTRAAAAPPAAPAAAEEEPEGDAEGEPVPENGPEGADEA